MRNQVRRMIHKMGAPVEVYNETGGGGRQMPTSGAPDDEVMMTSERGQGGGAPIDTSAGEEVEIDRSFRAVLDDFGANIGPAGDEEASILETQHGERYRVNEKYIEDQGVIVFLTVEE